MRRNNQNKKIIYGIRHEKKVREFSKLSVDKKEFMRVCKSCNQNLFLFGDFYADNENYRFHICKSCISKKLDLLNLKPHNAKTCKTCKKSKKVIHFGFTKSVIKKNTKKFLFLKTDCRSCYQNKERSFRKKIYLKKKNTRKYKNRVKRNYIRQKKRRKFSMAGGYKALNSRALDSGVNIYITKLQYQRKMNSHKVSELTGLPLYKNRAGHNLDRIGKIEFGGDGIRGGDYHIDNVVVCNFAENVLRELLEMTVEEFKDTFYGTFNSYEEVKKLYYYLFT